MTRTDHVTRLHGESRAQLTALLNCENITYAFSAEPEALRPDVWSLHINTSQTSGIHAFSDFSVEIPVDVGIRAIDNHYG